jgi:hypothetical protein
VLWVPFSYVTNGGAITITGYSGLGGAVIIPSTLNGLPVTGIANDAFYDCANLTGLTIPASVTNIGDSAFGSCTALVSIYFLGNAPAMGAAVFLNDNEATVCYLASATGWGSTFAGLPAVSTVVPVPFSYTTNGGAITITGYFGAAGVVIIPTNINGLPVTGIGPDAFASNNGLTSIAIPGSVTNIGEAAFAYCAGLENATISQGVTSLGQGAFYGCYGLTSVTIPGTVTNIGEYAFQDCVALTNVTLANGVTNIGAEAFYQCSGLTSATIPPSVTSIGRDAFAYCSNLTSVTIPSSITSIGDYAYAWCATLTNAVIPGSVTNIGYALFADSFALASVYFHGNAPAIAGLPNDGPVFDGDINAKVYYLPGATGWSSTFQGVPAVLWNPLIQTANRSFGIRSNQFGFNITGTANIPIVVEACTNLAGPVWLPLTNVTLTNGSFLFSDPAQMNDSARFYRISSP